MTPETQKLIMKGKLNDNASWDFILSDVLPSPKEITAVVCVPTDGSQFLIVRNKLRGWEFPGGHVEPNESLEQTVIREVEEESGFRIHAPILFGHQKFTYKERVHEPPYPPYPYPIAYISYFYSLIENRPHRLPKFSQEIVDAGLFSLEEADSLLHHWYQRSLLKNVGLLAKSNTSLGNH